MKEIWKDIKEYQGKYQVSNLGKIRTLIKWDLNKRKYIATIKNIKLREDKDGYILVDLHKNNKTKTFKVHRLVAEAFISNSNNYPQINHKNEIKNDNRVENLEWCSNEYNAVYGTKVQRTAEKHKKHILKYDLKGNFIKEYNSLKEASIDNNVFFTNISAVCRGKQKTAYGFIWKYKN